MFGTLASPDPAVAVSGTGHSLMIKLAISDESSPGQSVATKPTAPWCDKPITA